MTRSRENADGAIDNSVTLAKLASGTDGNIISYDASGNPVAIATGSSGQVLTSTGVGSPPAFETGASAGLVHIVTASLPTNAMTTGSLFNNFYSTSYLSYYFVLRDLDQAANGSHVSLQFNKASDQSVEGGAGYWGAMVGYSSNAAVYSAGEEGVTKGRIFPGLGNEAGESLHWHGIITGMQNTSVFAMATGQVSGFYISDYLIGGTSSVSYHSNQTTLFSGITITAEGNFVGGSLTIFGISSS